MDETEEIRAKFEAEYCPPVDPALVYSILSDYDLSNTSGRADATTALDQIRDFAVLEEAAEFDPSGTAADGDGAEGDFHGRTASRLEGSAASSRETDLSSVSNGLDGLDLSDTSNDGTLTPESDPVDLEAMDENTKVKLLLEVFKDNTTAYNVRHTLHKCGGRWDAAMEELLNHVGISEFLQAEGNAKLSNKSIDAFAEENGFRTGGRKGKGKRKGPKPTHSLHLGSNPGSPVDAPLPIKNKWQASSRDAEFVASRTGLPVASIQSVHNSHGASLPKTIRHILRTHRQKISQDDRENPALVANAVDLQQEFSSLEFEYIFALVHITHPTTASAHELAKELTARPQTPPGGIQIIPKYARLDLDETGPTWQPTKTSRPATPTDLSEYESSSTSDRTSMYNAARATAYQQAQAAYRKSRSNPLMGGAAAYYSQEGRNLGALSFQAGAKAADQLAARQSTTNEVDLHGIDVLNAVRIAQERVGQWYASLGENRVNGRLGAESRQAGYRIVVGLGTHSIGGKGKLGPAVSKALTGQGWKIEKNGAVILVKGR